MGISHARTQQVFKRGPTLTKNNNNFYSFVCFLDDNGKEDPNTTISEPPWFDDDDLTFNPGYEAL